MLFFKSINNLCWFFMGLAISACAHVTAPEDVAIEVEGKGLHKPLMLYLQKFHLQMQVRIEPAYKYSN